MKNKIVNIIILIVIISNISGCIEPEVKPTKYVMLNDIDRFESITEALENATDGDIITIYPGNYFENIIINKSIHLRGTNPKETFLILDKQEPNFLISINRRNCLIENLTLISKITTQDQLTTGIQISSTHNKISNVTITGFYAGIRLTQSVNTTILYNQIINNTYGIGAYNAQYNNISKNNFSNCSKYALYLGYETKNNLIQHNTFRDNLQAIKLSKSTDNVIINNQLFNNTGGITECCGSEGKNIIEENSYN